MLNEPPNSHIYQNDIHSGYPHTSRINKVAPRKSPARFVNSFISTDDLHACTQHFHRVSLFFDDVNP